MPYSAPESLDDLMILELIAWTPQDEWGPEWGPD